MSKYTTELRYLFTDNMYYPAPYSRTYVEAWFKNYELSDYLTEDQIEVIENANLFSKDRLATLIVDTYYMREIGGTPDWLRHYANVKMKTIMGKYLPLIYTASLDYNILDITDYTETITRSTQGSANGTSTSSSSDSSSTLGVNSDTPQGQISKTAILQGNYATETGVTENETTISQNGSSSSNSTGLENVTRKLQGNTGSTTRQRLIKEYRDLIINYQEEIIKELDTLFMGLW